jgi:hypothetical protein
VGLEIQNQKGDKMANLDGTSTVCFVWKVPTEEGVQALRDFFEFHYTYMKEKSYQHGPLELIQYTISESPEYELTPD